MIEDRLLVWRFNRGDTAALCRIYEKYRDGLLKVAAALLNDPKRGGGRAARRVRGFRPEHRTFSNCAAV